MNKAIQEISSKLVFPTQMMESYILALNLIINIEPTLKSGYFKN